MQEPPREQAAGPEWLAPGEPPARGETKRDRTLLDMQGHALQHVTVAVVRVKIEHAQHRQDRGAPR